MLSVALLAVAAVGCLTADGTLERDGTGTLALTYKGPPGATEATQRALLEAPGVTVESVSVSADHTIAATLKVTDLAGIAKTKLLRSATVTRTSQGEDEVLTITYTNPPGRPLADKSLPGPKIKITLPGKVVEANEKGVVEGSTVTWSFPLDDWVAKPKWELTARYRSAAGAAAPTGATGTATPPAP